MTYPSNEPDLSAVCPHLGLADDADSHATYATEAHRCFKMPNPTRIAGGHQETYCLVAAHTTCPIYTGEGLPPVTQAAAAAPPLARPPQPAQPVQSAVQPPAPEEKPVRAAGPEGAPGSRPKRPKAGDGQLRARPRAGGISMPAATIGLFALAIVLIAIAFLINQATNDDDTSALSEPDAFATTNALRTAQANQTQQGNETPAASETADGDETPAGETPGATVTTTAGAGDGTYTVVSGDLCGTIADDHGITLQELLDANDMEEADCNTLQVGQVLNIP